MREEDRSEEAAWWIRCLPHKHGALSSLPRTHVLAVIMTGFPVLDATMTGFPVLDATMTAFPVLDATMTAFPGQGHGDRWRQTLSQMACKQMSPPPNEMAFEMGNMELELIGIGVELR